MAESPGLKTFREIVLWPALAACLPWPAGFRMLRRIADRASLYAEPTAAALAGARMVEPVDNAPEWELRYRLTRLVDHCDMFLVRTRSRAWFERYVDVTGEWPARGPFIAMTFHWGAGLWSIGAMHAKRVPVHFVAVRTAREAFRDDWVAYRYTRARNRTVERAGGAPIIYTGGASAEIRRALAEGHAVVALYDVPSAMTGRTLRTTVCGREIALPAGLAGIAADAGVPVAAFDMGIDYVSGRRRLRIQPPFIARSAQDFADRLALTMTRLLEEDTAAWHFSHLAPHFFRADATDLRSESAESAAG
jgi:hypothetical protein